MTDYIGKMIMTYSEEGRPLATVEYPWPDGTVEAYENLGLDFVITDLQDITTIFVDNGEVKSRPQPCWQETQGSIMLGGTFQITNLPEGAKVIIGSETYEIHDGTFELESDVQATIPYSVELWPYPVTYGVMVFA